jgi:hypothetical protein
MEHEFGHLVCGILKLFVFTVCKFIIIINATPSLYNGGLC